MTNSVEPDNTTSGFASFAEIKAGQKNSSKKKYNVQYYFEKLTFDIVKSIKDYLNCIMAN